MRLQKLVDERALQLVRNRSPSLRIALYDCLTELVRICQTWKEQRSCATPHSSKSFCRRGIGFTPAGISLLFNRIANRYYVLYMIATSVGKVLLDTLHFATSK